MMWWENGFLRGKGRNLLIGGKKAESLAAKHGTPLYVYSTGKILSNLEKIRKDFSNPGAPDIRICYAMKANPHAGILKLLKRRGAWIDAVSPGEVEAALGAGFPPSKILFTGTSVSTRDLTGVFRYDGLTVNVDALEQLELMKEVRDAGFKKKKIKVAIRWNPGIGRGFNPRVITAGSRSSDGTPIKFGVEDRKVVEAFAKSKDYGFLPVGLHQHLGSGWVREDFPAVKVAVDRMVDKAAELENGGFRLEFLDFGGGFGPRYSKDQAPFPLERYAKYICLKVKQARLKIMAVAVEPGKYLVGDAGILLLRVEYVKESYGNTFACVDGGTFNTVPRTAIYTQAYHEIVNCSNPGGKAGKSITVAGNLCETGDVFGKDIALPPPKRGDILAVLCAGAYCRSMASHFNLRAIPKEILV